jgi:transcription antitermination factor NusA-like protein
MKKLFIVFCSFFPLYPYGPLERIKDQLNDIEKSIKFVQAEVKCGFAVGGAIRKLELEHDIVLALMQSFNSIFDEVQNKKKISEDNAERLISSKIDRFLKNMKDGCVSECFEQKFERKKDIQREIDKKLIPLEEHSVKSIRRTASKLKKQLEDEKNGLDDQIVLIVKRTAEATSTRKFKCGGA